MKNLDLPITQFFQKDLPKNINQIPVKIKLLKFVSNLVSPVAVIFVFTILIITVLFIKGFEREMTWLILSLLPTVTTYRIKKIIKKERPDPRLVKQYIKEDSLSFPSSHAVTAVVLFGFIAYLITLSGLVMLLYIIVVFAVLVCYSRIILGVHYASDVFWGIAFGLFCLWPIINLYQVIPVNYYQTWIILLLLIMGWVFIYLYYKKHPEEIPDFLRRRSKLFQRVLTAIIFLALTIVPIVKGGWTFILLISIIALEGIRELLFISKDQKKYYLKLSAITIFCFYIYSFYQIRQLNLGIRVLLFVIIVTSFADISGWFVGKFAKFLPDKKIVPNLSPGKTWRGTIASALIPVSLSIFLANCYHQPIIIVLTFIISIAAFGGDILASRYKRYFSKKDFSQFLIGHGGLLDRIDSQLAAITLIYWIIKMFNITIL